MDFCKNTWWYLFCRTCMNFSLKKRSVYLGENDFSMNIKCNDKMLSRNIQPFYSLDRFAFFALKTKICCRKYWQNKVSSPLTPWDPIGPPLEPLGPRRPTFDPLGPCRPTPWPPGTLTIQTDHWLNKKIIAESALFTWSCFSYNWFWSI